MNISLIKIADVDQVWPFVSDFINAAIEQQVGNKDYTLDEVMNLVSSGQWQLFVARREALIVGACTVSFFDKPTGRLAFITYFGGEPLITSVAFKPICLILKKFGVTTVKCAANPAAARLYSRLGFTEKYRILETQI